MLRKKIKSKNLKTAFNSVNCFIKSIHSVHLFQLKWSKIFLVVLIFKAVIVLYFYYNIEKSQCDVNLNPNKQPNLRSYMLPFCKLDLSRLGPIGVNKIELDLKLMETKYIEILAGGFYAPTKCRAKYRVAILIPYRDRETNLIIFLNHMHKFMKNQLLEYQIFVIEQIDKDRFNKGALFNIGYIVSRVFGNWHCYVFHDVDLLPIDDRILYSCPQQPTHLSSAVDCYDFRLPYYGLFGGVTILKPTHYEAVNGYSNYYWDWGAEDDDMYASIMMLYSAAKRYKNEGLNSIEFKLVNITKKQLFTHILTDVNPDNRMAKKQYKCV